MTDRISQKCYLTTLNNFNTALENVAWQVTRGSHETSLQLRIINFYVGQVMRVSGSVDSS